MTTEDYIASTGEEFTFSPWQSCTANSQSTTWQSMIKQEEEPSWEVDDLHQEVKKLFFCHVCNKEFGQRHNLIKHQRIHSGERPYGCDQCGMTFIQKQHLTKHQRLHTGERPYVCPVCSRGFSLKHNLTTHMRIHTGEKPFQCPECGKNFSRRTNLRTHQRSHQGKHYLKNKDPPTDGPSPRCKKTKSINPFFFNIKEEPITEYDSQGGDHTANEEPLEEHHQQIDNEALKAEPHTAYVVEKWDLASDPAENRPSIANVMCLQQTDKIQLINESSTIHVENPLSFICPECGERFSSKHTFVSHYRTHTGQKSYECSECGLGFIQKQNLDKHLSVHSGERPYMCGQCNQSFSMKDNLFAHLKIHGGEKSFTCSKCSKTFSRHSTYLAHQSIHYKASPGQMTPQLEDNMVPPKRPHFIKPSYSRTTLGGLKMYKCTVCWKIFKYSHTLNNHLRIHSGERPYSCQECGKNFKQKQHLTKHLRLHSGERPFTCQNCNKRFITKYNLIAHQRIHTGEQPYSCTECGKSFNRRGILNAHRVTHYVDLASSQDQSHRIVQMKNSTSEDVESLDIEVATVENQNSLQSSSIDDIDLIDRITQHKDSHTKGTSNFSCPNCGQIFGQREDLLQHEHLHKGERLYVCNQCGKRFIQKNNLAKHQKLHMGCKLYSNRSFSAKLNLISHQRILTGEKPFLCFECGQGFSQKDLLINHQKTQHFCHNKGDTSDPKLISGSQANGESTSDEQQSISGHQTHWNDGTITGLQQSVSGHHDPVTIDNALLEGPPVHFQNPIHVFKCPKCGKCFDQNDKLIMHLQVHAGERPYSCHICHKSFGKKPHLNKHIRLHTGERPYVCHCGRSFSLKHNLTTHQRIHTGERPYPCNQCGKRFSRRSILLTHEWTHRRVLPPTTKTGERRMVYLTNAVIQTLIKEVPLSTSPE